MVVERNTLEPSNFNETVIKVLINVHLLLKELCKETFVLIIIIIVKLLSSKLNCCLNIIIIVIKELIQQTNLPHIFSVYTCFMELWCIFYSYVCSDFLIGCGLFSLYSVC